MSTLGFTNIQDSSAGNNITQAQIKAWTTKRPFNHQTFWSNQRVAISASSDGTLWQFPFYKVSPTSTIFVYGWMHFKSVVNGQVGWYIQVESNRSYRGTPYSEFGCGTNPSPSSGDDVRRIITSYLPDVYETGTLNMKVGWAANDGGSNSPGDVWNPTYANDGDARTPNEQGSILHVWEVETS